MSDDDVSPANADAERRCDRCSGGAMELVRVNPGIGPLPELRTFRCGQCGHVETIEAL